MFETYYNDVLNNTSKMYYNYCGINRKDYPKWEGWRIIAEYKEKGIEVANINDLTLDALVRNFYLLKYMGLK